MKQSEKKIYLQIEQLDVDGTLQKQVMIKKKEIKTPKLPSKDKLPPIVKEEAKQGAVEHVQHVTTSDETALKQLLNRPRTTSDNQVVKEKSPKNENKALNDFKNMMVVKGKESWTYLQALPLKLRKKLPGYVYPSKELLIADEKLKAIHLENHLKNNIVLATKVKEAVGTEK